MLHIRYTGWQLIRQNLDPDINTEFLAEFFSRVSGALTYRRSAYSGSAERSSVHESCETPNVDLEDTVSCRLPLRPRVSFKLSVDKTS